jgi:hypothetical protein
VEHVARIMEIMNIGYIQFIYGIDLLKDQILDEFFDFLLYAKKGQKIRTKISFSAISSFGAIL